jgi:UDP-2,4-diacetamido-2,4,6-trideoxy-beta-L-altropyranose hydrolase
MAEKISSEGHEVMLLPVDQQTTSCADTGKLSGYASWLGADWMKDAKDTVQSIEKFSPSWLVVDHYAIDARWERSVKAATGVKIMAIDGLADREHDCDLLLDQTCSPEGARRWDGLVPQSCVRLVGPQLALLRPEFAEARQILRQRDGNVRRIFIAFGGVDKPNATSVALDAVVDLGRPDIAVDVVIGIANPNRTQLQAKCRQLGNVNLHIEPGNMAGLMLNADLAISGGGTMLLEQCYLHLPSIVVSIADNQVKAAQSLQDIGAVIFLGSFGAATKELIKRTILQLINDRQKLENMQFISDKLMMEPEITVSQCLLRCS